MKTRKLSVAIGFLLVFAGCNLYAQEAPAPKKGKKLTAYVSFINACTTDLEQRWQASVDINFKGATLATDMRIGEKSQLRPVLMDGKGFLEVTRHNTDDVLAKVQADLSADSFTSIVLMGVVGKNSDVKVVLLKDHPLPEDQLKPNLVRSVLLSAITNYPARISLGAKQIDSLQPGEPMVIFERPGEKEIKMFFKDSKFGDKELNTTSALVAEAGDVCNLIVYDSARMPGRPNILVINATKQRNELLEIVAADQMESKK